ncbi:calmodulin-binding protein 25 [Elaeis guineensis]|uniref:Calmodulin-binding protein 25 n=1 Tax=Elaeis guineensis var. tenera TaxID=51953 RepID=A0A6I9R9B3_ELAGV|nr:calmodulin-binding protein 25 [Elaeis guineensis]
MSENCAAAAAIDPWAWFSNVSASETEALTRALQISICGIDSTVSTPSPVSVDALSSSPSSLLIDLIKPEPTVSSSNPHLGLKRPAVTAPPATGRISKKKPRPSKRCQTTYINADPANFRQMVQQVTGVRLGDAKLPVEPVLKPEPQRAAGSRTAILSQSCLPTLDTSAFWLDRAGIDVPQPAALGSTGPVLDAHPGFEFEPFPGFPTLESWGVM